MTPEELLEAQNANAQAAETAQAFIIFSKQLKLDAETRLDLQQTVYDAAEKDIITKTEALKVLMDITAAAAVSINPQWIKPIFDAYSIKEVPQDQNFYQPLKTEIDNQLKAYTALNDAIKYKDDMFDKLSHLSDNLEKIKTQLAQAKELANSVDILSDGLSSEQTEQEKLAEEQAKIEANMKELKRLDELRVQNKYGENRTKSGFYFNFDIESSERFVMEKFIEKNLDFFDVYNSKFLFLIKEIKQFGEFKVTKEERRIDLISYKIYGSTQFWWMLLEYNDIVDQFSISNGDKIKFFDLSDLESKYHFIQKEQHKRG